jgi:hypothetical protein
MEPLEGSNQLSQLARQIILRILHPLQKLELFLDNEMQATELDMREP